MRDTFGARLGLLAPTMLRLSLVLLAFLAACVSTRVRIDSRPLAGDEEVVGAASGSAVGFMLFQFIPIGQNDRFQEAYERAILDSGGERLVDMQIWESWFWAWIGNGYVFHVEGTAVRKKRT